MNLFNVPARLFYKYAFIVIRYSFNKNDSLYFYY